MYLGRHERYKGRNFTFDRDRKSTRLNSSHITISYAVFCLKKKKSVPRELPVSLPSACLRLHCASPHISPPLVPRQPRRQRLKRAAAINTFSFFFFNDTATTEIYTLSLHDALPISLAGAPSTRLPGGMSVPSVTSAPRSEEHTSELQSRRDLVCRLLLEKKNTIEDCSRDRDGRGCESLGVGRRCVC